MADPAQDQPAAAGLMGWIVLLAMAGLSLAVLWLMGVRRGLFTASAAALLVGASGYALQGRPTMSGVMAQESGGKDALLLTDARHAFFGHFTPAETWLRISEALAREGNTEDAVGVLQNAVKRYPGDPQLWVGLGNALVDHAHGLTPPAELAYKRAEQLTPGYPGPLFFYGLALARSGDREGAVTVWRGILKTAPDKADWKPLVENGVAALSTPSTASPHS